MKTIFFAHIPKTAGTSFKKSILFPATPEKDRKWYNGTKELWSNRSDFKLLMGHYKYGVHKLAHRPNPTWVTFLRTPLDQQISHYYFIKQCGEIGFPHPQLELAKNNDLVSFYENGQRNMQTRFVAGFWYDFKPFSTIAKISPSILLAHAKRNIRKKFAAFGLLQYIEESYRVIAKELDVDYHYEKDQSKITQKRPRSNELSKSEKNRLRELNNLDYKFYDFALKLFEKRYLSSSQQEENHET